MKNILLDIFKVYINNKFYYNVNNDLGVKKYLEIMSILNYFDIKYHIRRDIVEYSIIIIPEELTQNKSVLGLLKNNDRVSLELAINLLYGSRLQKVI
jgi:hypothetical protein